MTHDLITRTLAARLAAVRRELYDNGEITLSGLRRLDAAMGMDEADTYELTEEDNDSIRQDARP